MGSVPLPTRSCQPFARRDTPRLRQVRQPMTAKDASYGKPIKRPGGERVPLSSGGDQPLDRGTHTVFGVWQPLAANHQLSRLCASSTAAMSPMSFRRTPGSVSWVTAPATLSSGMCFGQSPSSLKLKYPAT